MPSSSEPDQEEAVSTSSDEDVHLVKKNRSKRERKYYQPQDDDELFELEDSEEVSCTSEDSSEAQERKSHKRRKSLSLNTEGDSGLDADDQYDEDEVALQQAIAMSMAEGEDTGSSERLASSIEAGPSKQQQVGFDAEDEAMKQALAYSLTDQSPLAIAETEEKQLRGRIKDIDLAEGANGIGEGKSKAVKINNRPAGKGSNTQSTKGRKPAFPSPSLEMVQQAFQMLDPTGSGILNPIALREVAGKLLHKDLDDDQLDAMMEFANTMSHSEGEISSPDNRLVDAEAFCRLVARFASPE